MKPINLSLVKSAIPLLATLLATAPARAVSVPFFFAGTPSGSSLPVDVAATVTTGANTISIQLFNNLNDPTAVTQLISQFDFTLTGPGAGTTASLNSANQPSRIVNGDGTYSDPIGGSAVTMWGLADNLGPTMRLTGLGGDAPPPSGLVIGGPDGGGIYGSANGGIAGNSSHNPFFLSGVTFTISAPGVTTDTGVTNGIFYFGTAAEFSSGGGQTNVPDSGSTGVLLGAALLGLGIAARRWSHS